MYKCQCTLQLCCNRRKRGTQTILDEGKKMVKISSLCANWSVSKCVGGVGNEAFDKQI